jgi:hypothetical protein
VGREQRAEGLVVPAQDPLPRLVAHRGHEVRRADDVREHERLDDAAGRDRPAAQLPWEQLLDFLDVDGARGAGVRGFPQLLVVDAGDVGDVDLAVRAGLPFER